MMAFLIDAISKFITSSEKINGETGLMHLMLYGILNRSNLLGGMYCNSPIAFIVTAIITGSIYENNCSTKIINSLLFDAILMPVISKVF